jgi:hypothetical protein
VGIHKRVFRGEDDGPLDMSCIHQGDEFVSCSVAPARNGNRTGNWTATMLVIVDDLGGGEHLADREWSRKKMRSDA